LIAELEALLITILGPEARIDAMFVDARNGNRCGSTNRRSTSRRSVTLPADIA